MPREHVDNGRVELRLRPEDKAVLARAAALERLDLTSFILRAALPKAQEVITEAEKPDAHGHCVNPKMLAAAL